MPSDRGVSGFWLDIKALENARTTLIAELGAKEGMLAYGVWVRLFTWQYHSASPIKDAAHVARLTNLHIHKAQLLWRLLPQLLPRSLIRSPHGLLCHRTMQILDKANRSQGVAGAQHAPKKHRDPDPDPDPDLSSSLSPLETPISESKPTSEVEKNRVRNGNFSLFWSGYPIKRGKKRAEDVWKRKRLDEKSEVICLDVERRKAEDEQWGRGYIPHASTYLNGERWNDELTSAPRCGKSKTANDEALEAWVNDNSNGNTYEGEYEKH